MVPAGKFNHHIALADLSVKINHKISYVRHFIILLPHLCLTVKT